MRLLAASAAGFLVLLLGAIVTAAFQIADGASMAGALVGGLTAMAVTAWVYPRLALERYNK
jgi:hypothetical protein